MVYPDRPWWIKVHGHEGVRFLDLVNGGRKPEGPDFVPAVRHLCELAAVPFPERDLSPEEAELLHKRDARRFALEAVASYAQETLFSPVGKAALSYLTKERGFTEDEVRGLGLGFYDAVPKVRKALEAGGVDLQAAEDAGLLWKTLEGYVLIPWADAAGQPLTLYGRWSTKTSPEGRPKLLALPGGGTKGSPLYFDRARRAGHRDLVAVEGVFDAALLQTRGDSRVVAYVAAEFSGLQVETLARHKVRSVTVCPDPDGGGDKGAVSSVASLAAHGIAPYVTPRLPDGLDPDEFLLREGLEGWKAHVGRAVPGASYVALTRMGNVSPDSPAQERRAAVDVALDLVGTVTGPRAALDREDLLLLAAERTGYSLVALRELAEDHAARRRREERERGLDEILENAQKARVEKPGNALEVARKVSEGLASLQAQDAEPPPPFSVERLRGVLAHEPVGKRSGWSNLDELEVRFHAGELSVLGGRTGHGKTTALVGLLVNWLEAAEREKRDELLVFYSTEEPEEFVAARMVALLTAKADLRNAWTTKEVRDFLRDPDSRGPRYEWPLQDDMEAAWNRLHSWESRLLVVYRPAWDVDELAAHALDLSRERAVGAVLVDYLQRVPPPRGSYDRRDIEVSAVGRRLKALAVELSAPVVAGAQIGREAVKDASKLPEGKPYTDQKVQDALRSRRPKLHHLREGGSEQEADLVLGLMSYAADYTEDADENTVPDVTRLEVGVLKSRYGAGRKWAALAFEGRYGLLRDPERTGEV
jgi:DNA primase